MRAGPHWPSVLIVLLMCGVSSAAPKGARVVKATRSAAELFQSGQRLYGQGRFEEAVQAFSAANDVAPHRSALFNIARCYENLGRLKDALEAYRKSLSLSQTSSDRAEVERRIALLSRRPTKVFVASDPPGAQVTIDGRASPEPARTPMVVALRPGEHVLVLRKAQHQLAVRRVVVELGKEQAITATLPATPQDKTCPTAQSLPVTQPAPPAPLVEMTGVHVHISLMVPIIGTTDRTAEAGPGLQLHITVGRFLFGAHLLMNFQSNQPYSDGSASPPYDEQSFRRLIPELEGGWVFPFSNLYFYTSLGVGFHIDRPIFIKTGTSDTVHEWFAFAWSGGGGVEIMANRWVSLGAALRVGMAHGDRAHQDHPALADSAHHFPWLAFWAGVTVHL